MKKSLWLKVFISLTVLSFSCTKKDDMSNPASSTQPNNPISVVKVNSTDLKKVSDLGVSSANNRFGFNLFTELMKQDKDTNIFISPLSISTALAMTYNGANGSTRDAMAKTLELKSISTKDLNTAYNMLINFLSNSDPDLTISIANSLWLRKGEKLKDEFVKNNESTFGAKLSELDFSSPEAKTTINDWVAGKTNQKIKDLIKSIEPATFLYLINAIYFKGVWENKFDAKNTINYSFNNSQGKKKDIQMMFRKGDTEYTETDKYQAIKLNYGKEKNMSLYVFLPSKDSNIDDFYRAFDADTFQNTLSNFSSKKVNLGIPKFKVEYEKKLNEILKSLGMEVAFGSGADFTNMTPSGGFISEVRHKAFVEVNEEGAEAAAATSVAISKNAISRDTEFIADRPFFFVIADNSSNTILFMGDILDL